MTLSLRDRQLSFFDVSFLASNLFDGTDPYSLFRQKVLPALEAQRDQLETRYCATNGRPALDPVLVAGVTLLQFMEKAPDRQAVERLRMNLGWKHALGLAVDDRGFHATTLVYFRQRLLEHQQGRVGFDALLQGLEQDGLIARRGQQRLDSTHILAQVAHLSRREKTRETVRLFLEMLERAGRLATVPAGAALRERYLDSDVLWHKLSKEALAAKFQQTGQDMQALLAWVENHEDLRAHEKTQLRQRVFGEQFEVTPTGPAVRKQEDSGTVQNPHDPQAQWAAKDRDKTKTWVGYKAQIAETVPEESGPKAPKFRGRLTYFGIRIEYAVPRFPFYSDLKATSGSTLAARRAGIYVASSEVAVSTTTVTTILTRSTVLTPWSALRITRVMTIASSMPTNSPTNVGMAP